MDPEPLTEAEMLLVALKLLAFMLVLSGAIVSLVAAVQYLVGSL